MPTVPDEWGDGSGESSYVLVVSGRERPMTCQRILAMIMEAPGYVLIRSSGDTEWFLRSPNVNDSYRRIWKSRTVQALIRHGVLKRVSVFAVVSVGGSCTATRVR